MRYFLCLSLLFICVVAEAQNATEKQIEEIRKRFYRINGKNAALKKVVIGAYEFYAEYGTIEKVIHRTDSSMYEYYFDEYFLDEGPYFIYTIDYKGGEKLENRYYFSRTNQLIRWLDPAMEEVKGEEQVVCKGIELNVRAQDIFTHYHNQLFHDRHPNRIQWMNQIDEQVAAIEDMKLVPQILKYKLSDHNGFLPDYHFEYSDKAGRLYKKLTTSGDYADKLKETIAYFDKNGKVICSVYHFPFSEKPSEVHYYRESKLFLSKKEGPLFVLHEGRCTASQEKLIPRIINN